jgi:DNA-binding MarR family transcriptional regulator
MASNSLTDFHMSVAPLLRKKTDALMDKLLHVQKLFQVFDKEVPLQLVTVFCYIASHDPCHLAAIREGCDLSENSVSRHTDWLSTTHPLGKPGLGMISKEVDPSDARRKIVTLTDKGRILVKQLKSVLYQDLVHDQLIG